MLSDPSIGDPRFDGLYGARQLGKETGGAEGAKILEAIAVQSENERINGTPGDDNFTGSVLADSINGQDGNDTLRGGEGDDDIRGDDGDDTIFGDAGNDLLFGDAGADTISGGDGDDELQGGAGGDILNGDARRRHGHRRLRSRPALRRPGQRRPSTRPVAGRTRSTAGPATTTSSRTDRTPSATASRSARGRFAEHAHPLRHARGRRGIRDGVAAVAQEDRWIATEPPVEVHALTARVRQMLEDGNTLFVLDDGRRIAGTLNLGKTHAEGVLGLGMSLLADVRGQGWGRALLQAAIDHARGTQAHKIELEVWPDNARAIALYERFGFEVEGLRRDHYRRRDGTLRSAQLMALLL